MFVVNPWPMILKPFCMHFVSFPKTLKYFWMAVLWHRHRSVPATPIQRTGARWGTRFARTCLWLIYAYALSILHPGNRDIQKRSRDPFVFWVQASQSRWNKADQFLFGSWISLSCKFMCQTEIFVSVPLHPRKKWYLEIPGSETGSRKFLLLLLLQIDVTERIVSCNSYLFQQFARSPQLCLGRHWMGEVRSEAQNMVATFDVWK